MDPSRASGQQGSSADHPRPQAQGGWWPPSKEQLIAALIVVVSFGISVLVSSHSAKKSEPVFSEPPGPPTSAGLAGFPKQVDVVKTLEAARSRTLRDQLMGIFATGVKPDGSVDVSVPGNRALYSFRSAEGEGPVPQRPPGTLARRKYCGKQEVQLNADGLGALQDKPAVRCSSVDQPLPEPTCGPKEVWQAAIASGHQGEGTATVQYLMVRDGPAWTFKADGAGFELTVGPDCKNEVK